MRRQDRADAGKYRSEHFLDGGLAIGAGHADHRQVEQLTPAPAQPAKSCTGIRNIDLWQPAVVNLFDHGANSAFFLRIADKCVTIKAIAPQRDKQLTFCKLPRIDGDTPEVPVRSQQSSFHHSGCQGQTP